MEQRSESELPRWARALRALYSAIYLLLLLGVFAALSHQRLAAYLLLAFLVSKTAVDLLIGLYGYREVMRRPWPVTRALSDDDDDW